MHQARSVGLHTNEPGMMHAGVYENAPPSTASTTRTESEYRYTQKGGPQNSGRFGHPKKNATPPAAFGNAEAPMGQPFRDTQAHLAAEEKEMNWLPPISPRSEAASSAQWYEDRKGQSTPRRAASRTPSVRSSGARSQSARSAKGSPVVTPLVSPEKVGVYDDSGTPKHRRTMKTYTPRATPSGQLLGGSNKKASPMDVPAGLAYPHPPNFRPQENAHPDGWVDRPRDKTQSALFERYERSRLPHETYDVDGDGVVSTKDLYLASKFDVNGDGVLQDDEVEELRGQMITDILATYDDLPHAGETRCVKDIMKEFRAVQKGKNHYDKKTRKMRKPEEIIMHDSFRKKMNALQVNLKSQTAQDSRQMYQSLLARPVPKTYDPQADEQIFGEQLAFDKKWGFKPRS